MNALKIGIVEDEAIIAESLTEMLLESGYSVTQPATRYSEAIAMIEDEAPDLLMLDIRILGKLDGIDVARTVREKFSLPVIFLTANTDYDTIARAKAVFPSAFLSKPVTRTQLFAAIEIAIAGFTKEHSVPHSGQLGASGSQQPDYFFVKDRAGFIKVMHSDILFAESRENYTCLVLEGGKTVMMRSTFTDVIGQLNPQFFARVHRSFIAAKDKVDKVMPDMLLIGTYKVPVSKTYRYAVLQSLGIRGRF